MVGGSQGFGVLDPLDYEFACGQANPTNRETCDQLPAQRGR